MKTKTHLTTLSPASIPINGNDLSSSNPHENPTVRNFLAAREMLHQRKKELETELTHIQELLDGKSVAPRPAEPFARMTPLIPPTSPVSPAFSPRSNAGLREAVTQLLAKGSLTKNQIVEQLTLQKFEFFGKPKPALDPVLYSKKFRRDGKLFRLADVKNG